MQTFIVLVPFFQCCLTQVKKESFAERFWIHIANPVSLSAMPCAGGRSDSQVGLVDLHHVEEDLGNVPDHGLAHQEQGPQDSLPFQAGLLGGDGTLPQDEPAQQSLPLWIEVGQRNRQSIEYRGHSIEDDPPPVKDAAAGPAAAR